jgi:glycosyltransferase involved in cell wall biosynthesis
MLDSINSPQTKVAYILPLYDENTDTHLNYNYDLIRYASVKLDIFVVVEKAVGNVNLNAPFKVLKNQKGLARFFETYGILKQLRREGYNNFYVHYSLYGALAAWLAGGKVYYWNRGMPWLFRRGFWAERAFRFALRHSILVTGPESLAKEYAKRYRIKKYAILSNWIDIERFSPREGKEATKSWFAIDPGMKIILFVHHLSERKGADLISKIATGFSGDPNIIFMVIGDGPYMPKLKEEAKNLPIRIFGPVPNKDIAIYFQAADVFIMPSREEGSPHVILDALASGTPFVASDVGGTRETAPENFREFLCAPEDINCFREKIKKLLSDADLYEKLRAEGLEFARRFDRDTGVEEFVRLFR